MIWATVSSWSCFCWLYRASPSLAAENVINLISVLIICWCLCVESSLVFLEESICYDQCVLLAKLYYPMSWFILYSKDKFFCYSRYFWLPAEVWVSCGLPQGQGLWVQQTWLWHKPLWRRWPLTPPWSHQNLHRTGETDSWRTHRALCVPGSRRKEQWPHKWLIQTYPW